MSAASPITVLIVDDSAMVRKVLQLGFEAAGDIKVVGTAHSAEQAREMLTRLQPDVVTLDVEMPKTDGLTFLREIMAERPMPVVIISSLGRGSVDVTMRAMEYGAVDVIVKPSIGVDSGLSPIMEDIRARVRAAAVARVRRNNAHRLHDSMPAPAQARPTWPSRFGQKIMTIGSSTGGVQALTRILPTFPADAPAILIVQHMPEGFTGPFAQRLNSLCKMEVREARDGDLVQDGLVLIAPGGKLHMELRKIGGIYRIALVEGEAVCFSRPSVDVLFHSVARCAGPNSMAAILTGMGRDGAEGLLAIREAKGQTLAQDAETSVVFGMPGAAVERGAAMKVVPLDAIPRLMLAEDLGVRAVSSDNLPPPAPKYFGPTDTPRTLSSPPTPPTTPITTPRLGRG
jgi:two-component system, chemotaxis family, protein-glutamate methylesterase/glutaminase